MVDYVFAPPGKTGSVAWTDPAVWTGGVVPNSIDADVYVTAPNRIPGLDGDFPSYVDIHSSSSIVAHSLTLQNTYLQVYGSLNVGAAISLSRGGLIDLRGQPLIAGSIDLSGSGLQGTGTVTVQAFANHGGIVGSDLTINAHSFVQDGRLTAASGSLTVHTDAGGFGGISSGVLSGGSYLAAGNIYLDIGEAVSATAASITLQTGSTLYSFDAAKASFVTLESSLHTVSPGGAIILQNGPRAFDRLEVAGTVQLGASGAPSTLSSGQLTVAPGGTIGGIGVVASPVVNNGILLAGPNSFGAGTLLLNGAVTGTGTLMISPGYPAGRNLYYSSTLEIGAATGQDVRFSNNLGQLVLDDVRTFSGTVVPSSVMAGSAGTGSSPSGDAIILKGVTFGSITGSGYVGNASGGTLTLSQAAAEQITIKFSGNFSTDSFLLSADAGRAGAGDDALRITVDPNAGSVVCFAAGTLIRTTRGDRPVESLHVGDRVVTASGAARSIVWLGCRRLEDIAGAAHRDVWPVRVTADAFAAGRPSRDLQLSPEHAVCVDVVGELFIPVGRLVNGGTIRREAVAAITYWHVELESHDVLLANDLPSESYIDVDNRRWFSGGGGAAGPATGDAGLSGYARPFVRDGVLVDAVRAQLAARARRLGWSSTRDMDPHLVVDGVRVDGIVDAGGVDGIVDAGGGRFVFPAAARDVRLVSATFVPADERPGADPRTLGIGITRLVLQDGFGTRLDVPLDHAALRDLHPLEADDAGGWRWTDGSFALPPELWRSFGPRVALHLGLSACGGSRWVAPVAAATLSDARQRRAANDAA